RLLPRRFRRVVDGSPGHLKRTRSHRASPGSDQVGVALDVADAVGGNTQRAGRQQGERGLVTLAMGEGARVDHHLLGGDHDLAPVLAPTGGGYLDVGRQADAELDPVASFPAPTLFFPQLLVAGLA